MSVKLFDLQNGNEIIIKWFDKSHVQFSDGTSCDRRDVAKFYGDASEVMLKNVQAIVDNYLHDRKKFDYPGKSTKRKRPSSKQIKIMHSEFDKDCDKLYTFQPPESLTQDLLAYGAGLWIQKENSQSNVPPKHDINAPWIWLWSSNIRIYRSVGHDKIKEWLNICVDHIDSLSQIESVKQHAK